ncbi:hypothetical protein PWG15_33705 (plasmid) [Ensifer adhaerens]|uniref:COG3904 family protein n=1 Tax=Ensifer adhaerens TaxID=106592 RepID=UPI0023A9E496|nr:hypothetical protein [Ensifer adhaerens]WDZ81861.1 hypothetical protein PWG15_33705 [Ensifer adhaerens]
MRIDEPIRVLKRLDDGALMRGTFLLLLALTVIFLLIDVREIATKTQLPAFDPSHTPPFLPPAGTNVDPNRPTATPASPIEDLAKAMTFDLGPGGSLLAEGTLDLGAALRFAREIQQRGEYVETVELNSPGGSVDDALAISKLIRDKRLRTKVASRALCASSCPIILSGGVERLVESDAVVGVHQLFSGTNDRPTAEEAMSAAQSATARVARHLDTMGISAGLWFHALETPPDHLYYLTAQEMADFRLTTKATVSAKKKN